jgi:hypothetical protein
VALAAVRKRKSELPFVNASFHRVGFRISSAQMSLHTPHTRA